MATTQSGRIYRFTCPLGDDKLLFYRLTAREQLGRLFEFHLELLSEDPNIDLKSLLAQPVCVHVEPPEAEKRYFHGMVSHFRMAGTYGSFAKYQAVVRPWLWFLTRTADCKVFQFQTVPDIVQAVFRDLGFSDFEVRLSGSYAQREYCVQYRETDFDFVSRLLEQEGIYYYFKHEAGKHTLVLSDSIGSHDPAAGYEEVPYYPPQEHAARKRDHLYDWSVYQDVQTGTYALNDFDFEAPKADLKVKSMVSRGHPQGKHEVYDYPGKYVKTAEGQKYAKTRIEQRQAQYELVRGEGSAIGLAVGHLFSLTGFDVREDQNREYLIVSSVHQLQAAEYESRQPGSADHWTSCEITAIPSSQQYRTPETTPKPIVQGPQTATVVGKAGEEIWTDKYGRVKVQFHWDRYGAKDENSSCWVRVSQVWAGKQWGAMHIPRIGQEVIVDFLEGDPDQPIITGRVYNADNMPPYTLPANQTQSGLKSRSSKRGTADNFNELRFEDKIGEEQVYFHAEKNFDRVVENNDTLKVGFEKKDKGDQTIEIHNNQKLVVGNSNSEDGSQTIEIWKDRTTTIKEGNETLTIQKGNRTEKIDKGNDSLTISQGNQSVTISKGDQTVTISTGKNVTEAGTSIELKVGQSSIKLEPAKITIKSMQIAIEAMAQLNAKSPVTEVAGDGALTLKGGIIKIN